MGYPEGKQQGGLLIASNRQRFQLKLSSPYISRQCGTWTHLNILTRFIFDP